MEKLSKEDMQDRTWCNVYLLDGITVVPDYKQPDTWVLPGGRKLNAARLQAAGGLPAVSLLWRRRLRQSKLQLALAQTLAGLARPKVLVIGLERVKTASGPFFRTR